MDNSSLVLVTITPALLINYPSEKLSTFTIVEAGSSLFSVVRLGGCVRAGVAALGGFSPVAQAARTRPVGYLVRTIPASQSRSFSVSFDASRSSPSWVGRSMVTPDALVGHNCQGLAKNIIIFSL